AALAHLVDDIDRIAGADEILRPALAPVRRAGVIRTRHGAAVHHDYRIWRAALRRDHVFGINLADGVLLALNGLDMAAGMDPTGLGKDKRRVGPVLIFHQIHRGRMQRQPELRASEPKPITRAAARPTGTTSATACRAARSPLRRATPCNSGRSPDRAASC